MASDFSISTVHFKKNQTPQRGGDGAVLQSAVALKRTALLKTKVGNAGMLGDSQRGLPGQKTRVSSLFEASGVIAAHLEAVGRSHAAAEKRDKVVRRYL